MNKFAIHLRHYTLEALLDLQRANRPSATSLAEVRVGCCETTGRPDAANGDSLPIRLTALATATPWLRRIRNGDAENRTGTRRFEYRQPFDLLAVAHQEAEALQRKSGAKKAKTDNWLPAHDSNFDSRQFKALCRTNVTGNLQIAGGNHLNDLVDEGGLDDRRRCHIQLVSGRLKRGGTPAIP